MFKGSELLYVVVFLEIDLFLLHGKHVNEKWKIKKNNILFDFIRSINKLACGKKSKLVYTCHVQTYKKDNKEIGLIIHMNKIKSTPAWNYLVSKGPTSHTAHLIFLPSM